MTDLTREEQTNVRTALKFLRSRTGGWEALAKALHVSPVTLTSKVHGKTWQTVGASLAVRTARLAGVAIDDLLAGNYPAPGTCPHCGHRPADFPVEATTP